MDFKSYLQTAAQEINQEMDEIFAEWNKGVGEINEKLVPLNQSFVDACKGGKRLRGALVKLGYELARNVILSETKDLDSSLITQNDNNKEILKSAAAFEIFQTAILAHDDIIDKSDLRRAVPTIWKKLGGNHYGISQTICLGDVGFFLAFRLISESNFPEKEKNQAIFSFSNSMIQTGLGEILDVEVSQSGKADEQTYFKICKLKTAFYTLIGPMQLGAVLAGADKELLNSIETFGEKLGIAFQIKDDILGIFGEEEALGKSVTSDIEEGKITILLLYAKQNGSKEQNNILEKYYGVGKVGDTEVGLIRDVFIETGALDYSQKKAEELVSEAKKMISKITKNTEKAKLLEEMADFLVKRIS
ncbi:MAG: polyprenyl synthetase family protein [Candidatus Daviesbacteria bacterium]|nr:polyprenyl synthetase family protein [Candidatus Daviesbacteria bacterium]